MTATEAREELTRALKQIASFSETMAKTELELSERSMRAAFEDISAYAARAIANGSAS